MKSINLLLLLEIAKKGALYRSINISTASIARENSFSQQSVSRKLREIESEGLIERKASNTGIEVKITQKGRQELESLHINIKQIFSKQPKQSLKGEVVKGFGEGTYYTSQQGYKKQFSSIFGLDIVPGTLNLEVNPSQRNLFTFAPIKISGFETDQRTFGGIDCWKCKVNGKQDAVAIIPHRTNHPQNVIELVADINLRKKFALKDGDIIEITRK